MTGLPSTASTRSFQVSRPEPALQASDVTIDRGGNTPADAAPNL